MLFLGKYTFLDIIKILLENLFFFSILYVMALGKVAFNRKLEQDNKKFIKQLKKIFKQLALFYFLFFFIIIPVITKKLPELTMFNYSSDIKQKQEEIKRENRNKELELVYPLPLKALKYEIRLRNKDFSFNHAFDKRIEDLKWKKEYYNKEVEQFSTNVFRVFETDESVK